MRLVKKLPEVCAAGGYRYFGRNRERPGLSMTSAREIAAARLLGEHGHTPYLNDPAGFAQDVLGETLWSKQIQIAEAVRDHRHVAVQSCHGPGKSFIAGRVIVPWWLSVHPPGEAFAVTSAPTFPQVRAILWKEIRRAHAKANGGAGLAGYTNQTEWIIDGELVAFGRKPRDAVGEIASQAFQGIHAPYVLVVLDEGGGIPAALYAAAEGLLTNPESRILTIGHPDDPTSEFSRKCMAWKCLHISAFDTPNFTDEDIPQRVAKELVSAQWVEERREEWGEDSPLWASRVLGQFPESAEDALIPLAWVQQAIHRELDEGEPIVVSADIARFGADKTVLGIRKGPVFRFTDIRGQSSITEATGLVANRLTEQDTLRREAEEQKQPVPVQAVAHVDEVGVGAGVVDMLREDGRSVQGLNAGSGARDRGRFVNARAEWYWQLREVLEAGEIDLPDDPALVTELVSMKYKVVRDGKLQVESKDGLKARLGRSPDRADCVMLAFAEKVRTAAGPLVI